MLKARAFKIIILPSLCLLIFPITCSAQKVAVIGAAVTGSFFTRYLSDYDKECQIESITIFEPMPVHRPYTSEDTFFDNDWQGSRVATFQLQDGRVVELGASIGHKGFHLVIDMIQADSSLEIGPPFGTGNKTERVKSSSRSGMAIYDGNGQWPLLVTTTSRLLRRLQLFARYNVELLRVSQVCQHAQKAFAKIPGLLWSQEPNTFFKSPDEIWEAIGLDNAVHANYDTLLDVLGLRHELPWWRKLLPYQGTLRSELLTAINLVNYNQDNAHVNGIIGLGSFAAFTGGLFSVVGGNYKIIQSAIAQAIATRERNCVGKPAIYQIEKRVTTVVGNTASMKGFELYSGSDALGEFDIVVLAVPLQQSRIDFLVKSHIDEAVLQPMPLAGLVDAHDKSTDKGHSILPLSLPESIRRPYTQVVTTIVRNATLNSAYISLPETIMPRSILTTVKGKHDLHNITAISNIASSGIFKVFSDERLGEEALRNLFGANHVLECEKVWGGQHGGATPDYQGQGLSTSFLLFDGAIGFEGQATSGALYHPASMEQSSLASMEICAVGALAAAKLAAQRLGLLKEKEKIAGHDEL